MACAFSSAYLGLCEWTGCPGADADVTTATPTTTTPTTDPPTLLPSGPGQLVHAISLSLRNVYVATLFKLLGWTGQSAPGRV